MYLYWVLNPGGLYSVAGALPTKQQWLIDANSLLHLCSLMVNVKLKYGDGDVVVAATIFDSPAPFSTCPPMWIAPLLFVQPMGPCLSLMSSNLL